MARPISSTPVLRGEVARKFLQNLYDSIERIDDPAYKEEKAKERARMAEHYEIFKKTSSNLPL